MRRSRGGARGKIEALHATARTALDVRADCLLAVLGRGEFETESEEVQARVGALYLAKLTHDVEQIRRLLTAPSK